MVRRLARLGIMCVFWLAVYGGEGFVGWRWLALGEGRIRVMITGTGLAGRLIWSESFFEELRGKRWEGVRERKCQSA